jgi:hypothetical protein
MENRHSVIEGIRFHLEFLEKDAHCKAEPYVHQPAILLATRLRTVRVRPFAASHQLRHIIQLN